MRPRREPGAESGFIANHWTKVVREVIGDLSGREGGKNQDRVG